MAQYKNGGGKSQIIILIITIIFAIVGVVLIVVANYTNVVKWLKVSGIATVVATAPIIIMIAFNIIQNKIKGI